VLNEQCRESKVAKRSLGNLDGMSLDELLAERDRVASAIAKRVKVERAELQSRIAALKDLGARSDTGTRRRAPAKRNGSRPAGVKRKAHPLKGVKAEPKYRGPGGELWSGRGLAPRWLAALEQKGRKRDSYLIKD
jgi:DNA-binding protein H-NS